MAAPIYKGGNPFMSNIRGKSTLIPSAAAAVVLKKGQTGLKFRMDRASGTSYTLPAPVVGLTYEFHVTVLQTTGANVVVTSAAGIFMLGTVLAFSGEKVTPSSTLGPYQLAANGTSFIQHTTNGTTTGGGIGSWLRCTCISATQWYVEGVDNSPSGNIATPFTT